VPVVSILLTIIGIPVHEYLEYLNLRVLSKETWDLEEY
jgi:hypothetical protein